MTQWTAECQAPLSPGICSNWCPLSPWYYLTISSSATPFSSFIQHQGLFQWVSCSHQVAKVLELQLQHQSFQWHSGLISFRMDWFDLLAVQGNLKSLLRYHSLKSSILWHSAFFMVQFSHPYMVLTIRTLTSKVMSMLFNTLSKFVTAFLPRSKCLLISWLQSQSAAVLEPKEMQSVTASAFSPSINICY